MVFGTFERLVDPYPPEPPTRPPGKLLGFIWHYARPFRWLFLATIITSIIIAVIEVYAFDLVGNVVDWMTASSATDFWSAHGGQIIMICVLIGVIWPLLSLLDDLLALQGILGNMAMAIRWRGHRYLLRQSTSFFATDFAGRISTKLMQSAVGVRDAAMKVTNLFVYIVTYFATTLILFASKAALLAIPVLLWLAAYITIAIVFLPKIQKLSERQSDARSNLTGRIVDAYTNIQTVKLFASDKAEDNYARDGMDEMLAAVYPQFRVATGMSFLVNLANGLFIAGTLAIGTLLWTNAAIQVGTLAFAVTLSLRIQGISHYFLWELAFLFENIGSAQDGMKTLSKPTSVVDQENARTLTVTNGEIKFDNTTFHYGQDQKVLAGLNLRIAPGEKVGLVGRSGAGKSTLVNLLLRLYDVEGGRILIDDQDIAEVTQESLRAQIAMVTQDTSLLHRSIRENIAYGRPDATEEEIIAAAKRAEAWDFIQSLEDQQHRTGLDAHVGERGVKLSGGQRQRIAIARVILKDAPLLILDEATSALDSEVESAIQGRLESLMAGKTVLAIAHRLSTIAAMDRLIVLDQGAVIEEGTHDALISKGGLYAKLWSHQSGGFLNLEQTAAE